MKFTLLAPALLGATVLAAPKGHGLAARAAGRSRLSHPRIPASSEAIEGVESPNKTNVDYSSNWSGAVLTAPPSGTTFTSVSAEFTVPTPKPVNGQAGSSSAWVGIDGDTYSNAILQTGIDFSVTASGEASFDAWYEWYPDYAYDFSGISISAGDKISVSVVSKSSSAGTATIENLTNGDKVTKSLTAPDSSSTLGGQNAEWIVEDFEEGSSLVTLDNFGTVTFTGASAGLSDGSSVGTGGADIIDLKQNNKVLTSVTVPSSSEVVVKYV
ncbi:putative aspergillopepsin-2 precursor [Talaromyces proteolyticus]|uniref:Aspergillopepsin-2 n=1 Tax=Talaromyces proteolyticus TaxID=1131652 RepID=A0AAD4PVY0_9EURO|nr:putative aspergillopepsin-2 precursor [Talaromyces proteolyticus]KAH8697245.1 putative aspergillopepsin-2 precursor [Talaromyces proteolyticus]